VNDQKAVEQIGASRTRINAELSKVIVGQHQVIEELLLALFAGGHCLITGAPGLAKTLLVKSIAQIFHLKFQRIQFTPDLMPADITGTEILQETGEGRKMTFIRGPVLPTWSWPTRSTALLPRRRPHCWKLCRNTK